MSKKTKKTPTSLAIGFGTFAESEVAGAPCDASAKREPAAAPEAPAEPPAPPDESTPQPAPRGALATPPRPIPPASGVPGADVRQCPAALFPKMGASTLRVRIGNEEVAFTTSRKGFAQAKSEKLAVFVGGELIALAHAAQNDRVWPNDFRIFIKRKKRSPSWRLTPQQAFGCYVNAEPLTWTIGEMLDRIGATLTQCEVH